MSDQADLAPILINGQWQSASSVDQFQATNPATGETLDAAYPVSDWSDIDAALDAAVEAFNAIRELPEGRVAAFLRAYADDLDAHAEEICEAAHKETGYPVAGRLKDAELPRTTNQLRQAADCVDDPSWRMPVMDAEANLGSVLEPIGPVAIFGPNNFPLAFNGISGGDFAAAMAAGNPVIAKAHSCHPTTCRLLAESAQRAADATDMPAGTVQLLYGVRREDGLKLVSDHRVGGAAFTGSRTAGTALKEAADKVGKPIYLEMSSVNPVVILPGTLEERSDEVAEELTGSALLGTGQFCTNPGLVFLVGGDNTDTFLSSLADQYAEAPCGTLLSEGTRDGLVEGIKTLVESGAEVVAGNEPADREGFAWSNTLMKVSAEQFLSDPAALQTEAFGNATLAVIADSVDQLPELISHCEGNLTGCIYSAKDGRDDDAYSAVASVLRLRVGRLLNDKMPTGVAVHPAMNHGGPFPATGHPHFTAVGLPAAMRRFTRLACYDNVRPQRLPAILQEMAETANA
ncbi:MAG: aldehyde dehydrogenase (NADP(+)) [Phycisphaeraceae bacterium]|nr:aldehyde dehydrogenase (NADP(+)) [Phycisphaeraceae bacterium]